MAEKSQTASVLVPNEYTAITEIATLPFSPYVCHFRLGFYPHAFKIPTHNTFYRDCLHTSSLTGTSILLESFTPSNTDHVDLSSLKLEKICVIFGLNG